MRVVRHTDVATFARLAVPLLGAAEAENNLPLGICDGLSWQDPASPLPYLATVDDVGGPVTVALMTPPRKLVLSAAPREALEALCVDLIGHGTSVPGAIGRADVAETFAAIWERHTGETTSVERALRIYQLVSVTPPAPIAGRLRRASDVDLRLMQQWAHAFMVEAGLADELAGITGIVERAVRAERLYLWDDAGPVAMAAWTGPTPNGVRITLVYTPPPLRGRGYASACVAALSASLLASGRKFCFLFTDLANPTSNSIYQRLGYRPVCDVREYRFERRPATSAYQLLHS